MDSWFSCANSSIRHFYVDGYGSSFIADRCDLKALALITKAGAERRLSLGPKKSLGLERFFVKEIQTNAHWAGRDSSKLQFPPLFGPRSLEDRSKLLTCFVLYRRNLAWSLRNSKKVCDCYINDNHSHLQEFLLIFCNCFGRIAPLIFSNS